MPDPIQNPDTPAGESPVTDTSPTGSRSQEPAGGDPSVTPAPDRTTELEAEIERLKQSRAGWQTAYQRAAASQPQVPQAPPQAAPPQQQPQFGPDGLTAEERAVKQKAMEEMDWSAYDQVKDIGTQRQTAAAALQTLAIVGAAKEAETKQKASNVYFNPERVKILNQPEHPVTQRAWQLYNDSLYDPTQAQYLTNQDPNGTYLGLLQKSMEWAEGELRSTRSSPTGEEHTEDVASGSGRPGPKPREPGVDLLSEEEKTFYATKYGMTPEEAWEGLDERDKQSRIDTGRPAVFGGRT